MAAIKKEKIKDQMVKTAARLWEIPENEIEGIIEQFKNSKKVKFKYWWKDQEWRKDETE